MLICSIWFIDGGVSLQTTNMFVGYFVWYFWKENKILEKLNRIYAYKFCKYKNSIGWINLKFQYYDQWTEKKYQTKLLCIAYIFCDPSVQKKWNWMKTERKELFWIQCFFLVQEFIFFPSIFSTLFFCKVAESATFGMHRCSIHIWIGCCVLYTSVCAIEHAKASFLLLVACLIRVKGQYTNTAISRCDLPERHDVHGFVFSRCCCRLVIHSEIHKVNWRVKLRLKDVKEETIKTNSTNTQIIECSQRAEKNGPRALFPPYFSSLEWRYDATKVESFAVILFRRV